MSNQVKSLLEAVNAALAASSEIENASYDGIRGKLPRWAEVKTQEFEAIRTRLVSKKKYSPDQILTYIQAYTRHFPMKPIMRGVIHIPGDILDDISSLWYIRWAVMWGPTRGLPMLAGKTLAKDLGYRQKISEAQSKRGALPRRVLRDGDETIKGVIRRLADRNSDSPAKDIWPSLFSELERLLSDPEKEEESTDLRKQAYTYETAKGRAKITFGRFADLLAKYRSYKKIL